MCPAKTTTRSPRWRLAERQAQAVLDRCECPRTRRCVPIGGEGARFTVRPEGATAIDSRCATRRSQLRRLQVLGVRRRRAGVRDVDACVDAGDELDPELRQTRGAGPAPRIARRRQLHHAPRRNRAQRRPRCWRRRRWWRQATSAGRSGRGRTVPHGDLRRQRNRSAPVGGALGDRADAARLRQAARQRPPIPGTTRWSRQWYRATAAWMQLKRRSRQGAPRSRARAVSRRSRHPVSERAASAKPTRARRFRARCESAVLPDRVTFDVGSDRAELREAEAMFRRALQIKPDHRGSAAALGRVLGLLGRHAEAAVELRQAVGELTGSRRLLLLRRACFSARRKRRWASATPRSTPTIGRPSCIRWRNRRCSRSASSPGAAAIGPRAARNPAGVRAAGERRDENDDPWWTYYVAQARNTDELLDGCGGRSAEGCQ